MLFIRRLIVRKKKSHLRNQMRGYRILKETGQLDLLIRIKDEITNTPIKGVGESSSDLFFGAGVLKAENILRQFLILKFLDLNFNKSILIAIGNGQKKLKIPLPYEWRIILEKYGFQANTIWNKIIWITHIFFYFAHGVYVGLLTFVDAIIKTADRRNKLGAKRTLYFQELALNNLPQNVNESRSYDIITWYSNWKNRVKNVSVFYHSVKNAPYSEVDGVPVIFVNSAITSLSGFLQIIKYLLGLIWMPILAFFDFFLGNYWHALLLGESLRSFHFRILEPNQIPSDYLFHNAGYLFRPIWTYDAEKMGSRILFYFYSSNIERFKEPSGYGIQPYSWQIITWSNYLVWDEYQADFVRRAVGTDINIEIVGPINFQDSTKGCKGLPVNSVVVFDVQPHRDLQYQSHVVVPEYFIPIVVNKFLEDIYIVATKHNFNMVLKRKRHVGNILHKNYSLLIEKLATQENFISIDPDIAALRLVKETKVVISMPFTATALIARKEGKISIYYDPSGIVQKDDRGAHGIKIVSGIEELKSWFANISAFEKLNC